MDDTKIVDQLYNRAENALGELSHKYSRLYKGILREMLGDERDVDECESDLLLAVWNSIPPNRPGSLPAYICKIARNIGINRLKYNARQKRDCGYTVLLSELDDCIPDREADGRDESDRIGSVLSGFIRNLDAETRILFVRRYVYLESVTSLAKRFEMRENVVSVKLFRARKKLKKVLEKEDITL